MILADARAGDNGGMNRTTCALALTLSFLGSLLASGCCSCGDGTLDPGPKRPGDIVRDLRDAIAQKHWAQAKALFSDELQAQHASAMVSGEFFHLEAHRDVLADGHRCPCCPVSSIGADGPALPPEPVEVSYPLGEGDVVLAVVVHDTTADVTISPLHPVHEPIVVTVGRYAGTPVAVHDPRPQTIVLSKASGEWRVSKLVDSPERRLP